MIKSSTSMLRASRNLHSASRRSLASVASRSEGCYGKEDVVSYFNKKHSNGKNDTAYAFSMGGGDAAAFSSMVEPSNLMKEQLRYSQDQLKQSTPTTSRTTNITKMDNAALPKSLEDVVRQKSRALVVTECTKPFKVVDVNECWEGLCGYSFSEARGKTLGELLKGPNTNQMAATGLIAHLLAGEEAGAVLTNYTKEGREFRNRIRVGPLYDASGKNITHFVGVLQEIQEEEKLQM